MGLELRNWVAKKIETDLAGFDILSGVTLEDIARMAASKSALRPREWAT